MPGREVTLSVVSHRQNALVNKLLGDVQSACSGRVALVLEENQSTFIPVGTRHRLENPGTEPLMIIEVQSGSYLGEDDIERFEDRYGRG